jgi:hypothetical protein
MSEPIICFLGFLGPNLLSVFADPTITLFYYLLVCLRPNPRHAAMILIRSITHMPMLSFYPPRIKKLQRNERKP